MRETVEYSRTYIIRQYKSVLLQIHFTRKDQSLLTTYYRHIW